MAPTPVQRIGKAATTTSISIGAGDGWATPTSGNLLVATANSDATVTGPTGAGTWTPGPSIIDGNGAYSWYKVSNGTETSVSWAPSVNDTIAVTLCEYSGVSGTPFDVSNSSTINAVSGTSTSAASITTTAAGDLVIAVALLHGTLGGTISPPTGPSWTNSFVQQLTASTGGSADADCFTFLAELVVGAAGSYSTVCSWTNARADRQHIILAFKAGAAATATYPPQRPSPRRAVPARIARERITSVVPRQFNPPYPFQEVAQERRIRGLLLRRTKLSQTVPPQFNPPYPFAEVVQKRRLRGMPTRRGHRFDPAWPALTAPGNPAFVSAIRRLPRLIGFIRRERVAQVLPPDGPMVGGKRDRPIVVPARRGRLVQPVPAQQVAPTNPAFVPPAARQSGRRWLSARRGRDVNYIPDQQTAPTNPAWIPDRIRERVRLAFIRRDRFTPPIPAQPGPLPWWRCRPTLVKPRKGRTDLPLPQAIPPPPPAYVPQAVHHRTLLYPGRRGRQFLVLAACDCTVHRPDLGTVPRPSLGATARPDTGVVHQPCC